MRATYEVRMVTIDVCPDACLVCGYPTLRPDLCYFCGPVAVIARTTATPPEEPRADAERSLSSSVARTFAAAG